jgi:hypothetical protein
MIPQSEFLTLGKKPIMKIPVKRGYPPCDGIPSRYKKSYRGRAYPLWARKELSNQTIGVKAVVLEKISRFNIGFAKEIENRFASTFTSMDKNNLAASITPEEYVE